MTAAPPASGAKPKAVVPNIVEFTRDVLGLALSPAQEVILRATYGLPLANREQLRLFKEMTGLKKYPGHPFVLALVAAGVRGGKTSRIMVPVNLYEALLGAWRARRRAGDQVPAFALVAQNLRGVQGAAFNTLTQVVRDAPGLRGVRVELQRERVVLPNGAEVVVLPNTAEAIAGRTLGGAGLDEVARWAGPGKLNDAEELFASYTTRLFGLRGAKLVLASSFYTNEGLFFRLFKEGWGVEHPDRIVFKAPTSLLNPGTATEAELARYRGILSPAVFARDFLCEPSERISRFLEEQLVLSGVDKGVAVRPYQVGVAYEVGIDAAGSGADPFALSVGHWEGTKKVMDFARVWTKGKGDTRDPYAILDQMATDARAYNCRRVFGDGFARGYPKFHFQRQHGLEYIECDESRLPEDIRGDKSRNYEAIERDLMAGAWSMLDNPTLVAQLCTLDVELTDGGRRRIGAPGTKHEDLSDSMGVLGVALEYQRRREPRPPSPWTAREPEPAAHPNSVNERLRRAYGSDSNHYSMNW